MRPLNLFRGVALFSAIIIAGPAVAGTVRVGQVAQSTGTNTESTVPHQSEVTSAQSGVSGHTLGNVGIRADLKQNVLRPLKDNTDKADPTLKRKQASDGLVSNPVDCSGPNKVWNRTKCECVAGFAPDGAGGCQKDCGSDPRIYGGSDGKCHAMCDGGELETLISAAPGVTCAPPCADGTPRNFGNCPVVNCQAGYAKVGDTCVKQCTPPQVLVDGNCVLQCTPPQVLVNGSCVLQCTPPQVLLGGNVCGCSKPHTTGPTCVCESGYQLSGGQCVASGPSNPGVNGVTIDFHEAESQTVDYGTMVDGHNTGGWGSNKALEGALNNAKNLQLQTFETQSVEVQAVGVHQ